MKRRWRGRDRGLWGRERWRRIAKAKLQRDPLCAFCFAEGKVVAARVADHKTPHHNDMGFGATSGLMVTRSIRGIPVSTMKVPPARAPIWAPAMTRTRSRLTLTPASRCDRL